MRTSMVIICLVIILPLVHGIQLNPRQRQSSESDANERALKYDYNRVLYDSLLFYEAQRSGLLPVDNRVTWRSDSCTKDFGNRGEDLTGGYYSGARALKFTFPTAAAMTVLAWGLINNKAGYNAANQYLYGTDALNWGVKYLSKCFTANKELYVLVGDVQKEIHGEWTRPEDITYKRPTYAINSTKPGSEVAAEVAAALAAGSVVLKDYYDNGPKISEEYLNKARQLYEFAVNNRGDYSISVPEVAGFYKNWSGDEDELVWAALWLYRATAETRYLNEAKEMYQRFNLRNNNPKDFSWDNKVAGVKILLHQFSVNTEYKDDAIKLCDKVLYDTGLYTPKGLLHVGHEVGILRYTSNIAFVCFELGEHLKNSQVTTSNTYLELAIKQVNYILGDTGFSYVVGFGNNYPLKVHHVASSCPDIPETCNGENYRSPYPNPHVLIGGLVGGPDKNDNFEDSRGNFAQNEVQIDYNAGFQSLIAGLLRLHKENALPDIAYKN